MSTSTCEGKDNQDTQANHNDVLGVDGRIIRVNEADLVLKFVEVVEESRLAGANVALNDHREGSPRR